MPKDLLSHGKTSTVYVPIMLKIFRDGYAEKVDTIDFTLDDIRTAADTLGVRERTRNSRDCPHPTPRWCGHICRRRSKTLAPSCPLPVAHFHSSNELPVPIFPV